MIYTLIISLVIEKPFYLSIPQSFSFQIVSEFIDMLWNSLTLCSGGGAFDSLFCPEGRVFVHNDCPGERVFDPFKSCPGGDGYGWNWYLHKGQNPSEPYTLIKNFESLKNPDRDSYRKDIESKVEKEDKIRAQQFLLTVLFINVMRGPYCVRLSPKFEVLSWMLTYSKNLSIQMWNWLC